MNVRTLENAASKLFIQLLESAYVHLCNNRGFWFMMREFANETQGASLALPPLNLLLKRHQSVKQIVRARGAASHIEINGQELVDSLYHRIRSDNLLHA